MKCALALGAPVLVVVGCRCLVVYCFASQYNNTNTRYERNENYRLPSAACSRHARDHLQPDRHCPKPEAGSPKPAAPPIQQKIQHCPQHCHPMHDTALPATIQHCGQSTMILPALLTSMMSSRLTACYVSGARSSLKPESGPQLKPAPAQFSTQAGVRSSSFTGLLATWQACAQESR